MFNTLKFKHFFEIISIILLTNSLFLYSQKTSKSLSEIDKYFSSAIKGESYYISKESIQKVSSKEIINKASQYLKHDESFVRYSAIDLLKRRGLLTEDKKERQKIVYLLVNACKDKDGGNAGYAVRALTLFQSNDFNDESKDSLLALLSRRPSHFEVIIRLAGFIGGKESEEKLKNLLATSKLTKKEEWAIRLALARLGDRERLEYCMEKIISVPVNDKAVTYLFPDVVYIRQPEAIDYILNEILSDEKKCLSSDPDREVPIICAFKIIELIAPVIEGFPVKVDDAGLLDIDDYDKTLEEVKNWIRNNSKQNIHNNYHSS